MRNISNQVLGHLEVPIQRSFKNSCTDSADMENIQNEGHFSVKISNAVTS